MQWLSKVKRSQVPSNKNEKSREKARKLNKEAREKAHKLNEEAREKARKLEEEAREKSRKLEEEAREKSRKLEEEAEIKLKEAEIKRRKAINFAEQIHRNIPAERWGVTKSQFQEFIAIIYRLYKNGEIKNECVSGFSYDSEKFQDPDIGPNIHQINEQVIKPITKGSDNKLWNEIMVSADSLAVEPMTSWALMKNPKGVDIDLFVSHAWDEGVFEFGKNLLENWPEHCNAAYVCFLANPQNLDVSKIVGESIVSSPFHVALKSDTMKEVVTMIASQNVPIHSRLWCCYAFVAMELRLQVHVAGDSTYLINQQKELEKKIENCEQEWKIADRHKIDSGAKIWNWLIEPLLPEFKLFFPKPKNNGFVEIFVHLLFYVTCGLVINVYINAIIHAPR